MNVFQLHSSPIRLRFAVKDQEWIFRDKINRIFAEQMSNWAEILNILFKKSWIPYKEITKDWIFRDKINQIFAEQMSNWAGKDFMIWRSWNNNVKQQQKTIYDWNQQKTTP